MALDLLVRVNSAQAAQQFKKFAGQTNSEIKKVQQSGRALQNTFGGINRVMGALGLAGGLVGTIALLKKSVQAFGVQEAAAARLDANLKNVLVSFEGFQRGSDEFKKELERRTTLLTNQAVALQQLTTFGNEQTISAQAMLSTFALTGEEVAKLTPAVLDMGAASEKSSGQQADLEQISIAVGKALTIGVGSLTRYGVVISQAAKDQFEFATQAEKVDIILRELNLNFQGVAAAVGKTKIGRIRRIGNAWTDLLEHIGDVVLNETLVSRVESFFGIMSKGARNLAADLALARGDLVAFNKIIKEIKTEAENEKPFDPFQALTDQLLGDTKRNQAIKKRQAEAARRDSLIAQNKFVITKEDMLQARHMKEQEVSAKELVPLFEKAAEQTEISARFYEVQVSKSAELIPIRAQIAIENERAAEAEEKAQAASRRNQEQITDLASISADFAGTMLEAALYGENLEKSMENFAKQLAVSLVKAAILSSLTGGAGGGLFSSFFGGFQHGGSFKVPGSGGIDSQLVGFRATPGETVTVTPPGQTTNNNQNISVNLPNVTSFDYFTVRNQLMPVLREVMKDGGFF